MRGIWGVIQFILAFSLFGCASAEKWQKTLDEAASAPLSTADSDIIGGKVIAPGDPAEKMALLLIVTREGRSSTCTAVAVSRETVLTAAHCVAEASPSQVRVALPQRAALSAKSVVVHEKFDGTPKSYGDLAAVKLAASLPADYPIFELYEKNMKTDSDEVLLVGYGITGENERDSMVARKIVKSFRKDLHLKSQSVGIDQQNGKGGFCRGDSGAPIFIKANRKTRLLGINSFTVGTGPGQDCQGASVAMSVPYFSSWIREKSL